MSSSDAIEIVGRFLRGGTSNAVLVLIGPSGVGKTHLVRMCAKRFGKRLLELSPEDLSNNIAGAIEAIILGAFNPRLFDTESEIKSEVEPNDNVAHVVFIDDIDVWAPSKVTSPLQVRITATLNDIIPDLVYSCGSRAAGEKGVRFIATASAFKSVHPSLVRSACLNHVMYLSALSYMERKRWCLKRLVQLYPSVDPNDKQLSSTCDQLAFMTPGYVHADMHRLFSFVSHHRRDTDFPGTPARLVESMLFREASRCFTPTLLSLLNPLLTALNKESARPPNLYGMSSQLTKIKQCLNAVFTLRPRTNCSTRSAQTAAALCNIRTLTGILLHGPTGCGKSTLVQYATKLLPGHAVNVLPLDSASIVSSIIGQAERNLAVVFSVARMIAPTVVIVDNVDLIAPRRDENLTFPNGSPPPASSNESFNRLLSTLLVQIDGIRSQDSFSPDDAPVLVIATTRNIAIVDPALLRPGRIDVHIPVVLPDRAHREQMVGDLISKALDLSLPVDNIDRDLLVNQSYGWSTAEVLAFVRQKILRSIDIESRKSKDTF